MSESDPRPSWDDYYMQLAHAASTRSTCLRLKVGAVLVAKESHGGKRSQRGTGYNGAPTEIDSCLDLGECDMRDGHCIRAVHAEINLILQTDARDRDEATVYITDRPCWHCANALANSGIKEVVFDRPYHRDEEKVFDLFRNAKINIRQHQIKTQI